MRTDTAEYGSLEAFQLLDNNALTSLASARAIGKAFHKRYGAKSVAYVDLDYNGNTHRVYIKRQWKHSRIIPRIHSFRCGKAFQSYPLQEWNGLHLLRSLGLDTAEPLALFRNRWHPYRAAVITRAVPGKTNLTQMLAKGVFDALSNADKVALSNTLVAILEKLHVGGLGWRSIDIKHFYPDRQRDGSWKVWLIDCEGVYAPVNSRYIERERRSVLASIRRNGQDWISTEHFAGKIENQLFSATKRGEKSSCAAKSIKA